MASIGAIANLNKKGATQKAPFLLLYSIVTGYIMLKSMKGSFTSTIAFTISSTKPA